MGVICLIPKIAVTMRAIAVVIMIFTSATLATDPQIDRTMLKEAFNKDNNVELRNRLLEGVLNDLIEQIRTLMRNGSENFPVLDPLQIGAVEIDELLIGSPGAYIRVGETVVENLSAFVFDTLRFAIEGIIFQRYVLTFDVHIPEISAASSSYDLSFKILGGDVYGNGVMNLKIVRPRVRGVIGTSLRIENGVFLNINDCEISVSLGDFKPVITGLWNNTIASDFISRFFGNLIPELMSTFETEINQTLSIIVKTVGNEILKDINIIDLIPQTKP
ncbi:unnamed protein product [Leptosia nina]|uniref:Uncharacterized protein n=1 Tax=Leptosia nina TaxID=320188 RepID=A0AAV1JHB3_9NEOP